MKKIMVSLLLVVMLFGFSANVFATDKNTKTENLDSKNEVTENSNGKNSDNYNNFNGSDIVCGNGVTFSTSIVNIAYYVILVFQVAAPIVIVVFGMFDLAKSIMSGKDDDIKKGQSIFFKRLIAGIMVFLVITITKIVLNVFASNGIVECVNCFFNGANSCR